MLRIDRREFLKASAGAAAALSGLASCAERPPRADGPGPFQHGVASGDPLADRVILWTRISWPERSEPVSVRWQVARDPGLREEVASGRAEASAASDFTVKVDASGLEPGKTWFYRFEAAGHTSPLGRTRTLPAGSPERVRLAFCSCACLPWGFFNAYAHIAERDDLDAVLHLGDYLYEHANGEYGDGTALGRVPRPDREIVSLADYRTRHAQYKADPDTQALHASHPVIAVWDDHEITNDAWRGGAQNHQDGEGSWEARRNNAVQAYFEWMPIREQSSVREARIYRAFRFGDLADLAMLDTRLVGRDRPDRAAANEAQRSLLGAEQERWLFERLDASERDGVIWKVLGQQVMLGALHREDGAILSADKWDGYAAARTRLFDHLESHRIRDTVVLTGDFHSSWALDLPREPHDPGAYDPATGRGSLAVELLTPGVSAPGYLDVEKGRARAEALRAGNPHVRWIDFVNRGYGVLDLDRERARGDWIFVETVRERRTDARIGKSFRTLRGRNHLEPIPVPARA